jgi:Zn-dependent M28 family amino/carboxypeptidase
MIRNFLAAAMLASCAAAQTPTAAGIAARLTANNLKADVSFLASDTLQGRGTPSPGLDVAAEFVASQFRAAGLEPAGDDGYFQTAAFVRATPNQEGRSLTLEIGGKTIAVDPAKLAAGDAPGAVDVKGAAVLVATSANGLTAEQARGKVVVFLPTAGARFFNAAALARLEAALVVTVPANAPAAAAPRVRAADAKVTPVLQVWDPAFADALASAKPGPSEGTISAHVAAPNVEPVKLKNVVGVLRGADASLRDTYVLVTGHYDHLGVRGTGPGDHIYNGANDDASGTSSVIEIARTLASLAAPKRSLVFVALFGEELGLLGSRYYAQHPIFPLAKTVADLNLEQMGRTDDVTGPRAGLVNATGFEYTDMTPLFAKAGAEFDIKVEKDEKSSDPFFARSDNQAFADAGIPSHTFSVGYVFPDYHQPGDEWPKIDYENMAKVDRAIALGLWRIADNVEPPRWSAIDKTERYRKAAESLGR